ncbi:MAG: penicillin-binding protein 2 [Crocinitomicaceae bacterium]|nr:penicillin-binding protein 2 [Crocinitomicaceae bacterium]
MNSLEYRKFVVLFFIAITAGVFSVRMFYMQIIDDKWKLRAEEISKYKMTTYPTRGIVYDRSGNKLIANETYYDIMMIEDEISNFDTTLFCQLFKINKEELVEIYQNMVDKQGKDKKGKSNYRKFKPYPLITGLSSDDFSKVATELQKFPGFFENVRTLRKYPQNSGAHVLGYMNEVDGTDLEKDHYYRMGDYIGRTGIENYYEEDLRGRKGVQYLMKDARGNISGSQEESKYDTAAVPGRNLELTLDADLQTYGELLMKGKIGSVVAIEPSSGEILAFVSSPTYDPNLLIGKKIGKNFLTLQEDSLKPLFNRPLQAKYPPGSTFKLVTGLIGMQMGVVDSNRAFSCIKSLVNCHGHPTALSMSDGVKYSCNPYFYQVMSRIVQQGKSRNIFKDSKIGLAEWYEYVRSFGLGQPLNIDLAGDIPGFIPDVEYYDKVYNKAWAFSTIYSISIGQGEVGVTPIQMANLACIMANRGYYYVPHLVKSIKGKDISDRFQEKHYTKVKSEYFNPIVEGMWRVVHEPGGTARRAKTEGLNVCGKTGTAQNPHGEDHSIFIAFAPKDNPKIAIAVYVENAGFGGTWAAPIASLMIEKFLNGEVKQEAKEKRIIEKNFLTDPSIH